MAADAYFFSSRQVLSAVDELRMSVSRFRLKTRDEELAEAASRRLTGGSGMTAATLSPYLVDGYAISTGEVQPMQAQLVIELGLATSALQRSHRQHRYLKNLQEEEEKRHERRRTAASSSSEHFYGSDGNCSSSMHRVEDSGVEGSAVKKRQKVDSSMKSVNGESEDKQSSIQTTANSSTENLSKEKLDVSERDGMEGKLTDATLEEKQERSLKAASIDEQSDVAGSTTSSRTATTAGSRIHRERKDSVHTLLSDQENPAISSGFFSSSSGSSAHREQPACISAGVLEEEEEERLACMRDREEGEEKEDKKEVDGDRLPSVVTPERGEQEDESTTCAGSSPPQQRFLSGNQGTSSFASDQSMDKPSLQGPAVADRSLPGREDREREDKRVCPVCFTELGENSFTAVLPCAHQLCIECSKTLRAEKVCKSVSLLLKTYIDIHMHPPRPLSVLLGAMGTMSSRGPPQRPLRIGTLLLLRGGGVRPPRSHAEMMIHVCA